MDKHNDNIFCEYTIKSWEDGRKLFKLLTNWIFRGQSDSSWPLQTSLERSATINQLHCKEIPEIEKRIIEKFKQRAFNYIDNLPEKEDTLEWLSIMQHHGAPTRLLDFSLSFYIALYFSIVHALKESSVYCLNKDLIFEEGNKRNKLRYNVEFEYGTKEYCNYLLNKPITNPLVLLIEPYNLHERLSRQQGIFAIPFECRQAFEYNLSLTASMFQKDLPVSNKIKNYNDFIPMLNKDCILLKVNIPKSFHNEIIKDLKLMNITSETLFPGIDGFTKSLTNEFDL